MDSSFYLTLLDEIALDGLRGITFESLWIRLEERDRFLKSINKSPLFQGFNTLHELVFQITVNEISKGNIQFFKLPKPRKKILIYDRTKHKVAMTGTLIVDDSNISDNLYPTIILAQDERKGIIGSCEDFKERVEISNKVQQIKSFKDFKKQYKLNQVALVASQKLRAIALLGINHWQDYSNMKPAIYLILESIGSKRWYGEMNLGKEAPVFDDTKIKQSFHYLRKTLLSNKLVFLLYTSVFVEKRNQITLLSITYLPRFRPIMANYNDWKIIELSKIFLERGQTRIPFSELKHELSILDLDLTLMKSLRRFFSRYSSIIKLVDDENQKGGIIFEYLCPLDRPLSFDDLFDLEKSFASSSTNLSIEESSKSIVKGEHNSDQDSDYELNVDSTTMIKSENDEGYTLDNYDAVEQVDFEDDGNFKTQQINWDNIGFQKDDNEENEVSDFDYESFFNVKNQLKPTSNTFKLENFNNQRSFSIDPNQDCKEIVLESMILQSPNIKLEIVDRRLCNLLKITPKFKYVKTNDSQVLKLPVVKLQKIDRFLPDRFYWLIKLVGKISRLNLSRLMDLPNNTIRNLIKFWQNLDSLTYTIHAVGRQSIFLYETKTNSQLYGDCKQLTIPMDKYKERFQIRAELLMNFMRDVRVMDSLGWIRRHVAQFEKNLGFFVDIKSIIRILNQLSDLGKIKLFHYNLQSRQQFRNCTFVFYVEDNKFTNDQLDEIMEHLKFRTTFNLFSMYPVDLKTEIHCRNLLDDDGHLKLDTGFNQFIMGNTTIISEEDGILSSDKEITTAYRPSSAQHLYGCRSSKIEKMFELYRFLFHLLVDYDQEITKSYLELNDWRNRVPSLTRVLPINRVFSLVDILPYMPLIVLRDVVTIRYEVPGLEEYLNCPVKKNLMLYEIPPRIRVRLFQKRRIHQELQELFICLTYMELLSDVETFIKDKKFMHRYKFQLNTRLKFKQPSGDQSNFETEYHFRTIQDFDQFTDMVYLHLMGTTSSTGCPNCPFDQRLNLHSIHFSTSSAKKFLSLSDKYDEDGDNKSYTENRKRKRKQNLKQLKNKRIKMEIKINGQPVLNRRYKRKLKSTNSLTKLQPSKRIRAIWTKDEDNFLLKCRLVLMLMNNCEDAGLFQSNRYTLTLDHVCQLLHHYIGKTSENKSTKSCQRRTLRLIKKPQIKRVLKICFLELKTNLNDEIIQMNDEDYYGDDEFLKESEYLADSPMFKQFKRLLDRVLDYRFVHTEFFMKNHGLDDSSVCSRKIQSFHSQSNENIDSLFSNYEIINPYREEIQEYYLDPKNYYDIHSYAISNVLMSSLISFRLHQPFLTNDNEQNDNDIDDETKNSSKIIRRYFMRTIFKALKHFPDSLVRLVLKRLCQFRFISHNKKIESKHSSKYSRHKLQPYAYKLGQVFFRDLCIHHFTYELKFSQQISNTMTETIIEDNNSVISALGFSENFCVDVLEMFQQPIQQTDNDDSNTFVDFNQPLNPILLPPTMLDKIQFQIDIPDNFILLSKDVISKSMLIDDRQMNKTIRFRNSRATNSRGLLLNRNNAYSSSMEHSNKSDLITVDDMSLIHCKVKINQSLNSLPTSDKFKAIIQEIFNQKLFNYLSIHLQFFNPDDFNITISTNDQQSNNFKLNEDHAFYTSSMAKQQQEHYNELLNDYTKNLQIPFGLEKKFSDLIEFIQLKKELGATMKCLMEDFFVIVNQQLSDGTESFEVLLRDFLFECQRHKLIFGVGIMTRCWVHRNFIRYWLVHSFKNLDFNRGHLKALDKSSFKKISKVCFLPKMWKSPDGNLDRKVLFLFLNRILGFLMNGGLTLNTLAQKHFREFLPKVQLLELLELLILLDCIRTTTIDIDQDLDNFQTIMNFDDFFDKQRTRPQRPQSTNIFYEANLDAYLRLTIFHQILIQNDNLNIIDG